jgi:hypothetical protein
MAGSHFDTLVRTLATRRLTRAQTLRGLVASGVAALTGITLRSEEAVAKKQHEDKVKVCQCPDANAANCHTAKVKKSRAKKQVRKACNYKGACRAGVTSCATLTPLTPGCTPNCDRKVCGPDGCGGSCGTCGAGLVCATGQCASSCPGGQKVCGGTCIPNNQCCTNSDCPQGTPQCCGGACVNVLTDVRNCGSCGAACLFNEVCTSGACLCIAGGGTCSTTPGTNCCNDPEGCGCQADPARFLEVSLTSCLSITSTTCGEGFTECIATTNNCGGGPARTCCPPGTTCDEGACRYV